MLFHSSIRKEMARSFGVTLIVLATVVITMTLIRTLGQAASGNLNPSDVMVVMALALLVLPWSNQRIEKLKDQFEKRSDIERVEPGQFQESAGGKRVFFVEKDATGKLSGSNVFIATAEGGKETITSARSGRIQTVGKEHFLLLSNGQRLESMPGKSDLKISEFETYSIRVDANVFGVNNDVPINTLPTLELLKSLTPVS